MFTKDDLNSLVTGNQQEKVEKAKTFFFPNEKVDIDRLAALLSLLLDAEKSTLRNWLDLQNLKGN
jgi:hypothetical protein